MGKMSKRSKHIWNEYTEELSTVDFAGHPIIKSAFNDSNSKYCWNIDHILPVSIGNDIIINCQPTSFDTNYQKSNNLKGHIEHIYNWKNGDVLSVKTFFEIATETINNKYKYGVIYINKQIVNNNHDDPNIQDIYYANEVGYYFDKNNIVRSSILDVKKSFYSHSLQFIDGNNPKKWPITNQ